MTIFDSSTGALPSPPSSLVPPPDQTYDSLAALRDQIGARDSDRPTTVAVDIPGLDWRLICRVDVSYQEYIGWQKAAQRNKKGTSNPAQLLWNLDRVDLAITVLLKTCESMEQHVDGEWITVLAQGEPLQLDDNNLLRAFNVVDPRSLLRRLFGTDPQVMAGSEIVIQAAGWIDGGDDDMDPTG